MMLLKLALRNVRRQIGGYLIYFVTVALTVSLLFSLASLMFSEIPRELSMEFYVETMAVCVLLAALLTIVSALVLGYGTAWVSAVGCTFEGNGVGLHFNSTDGVVTHVTYNDNIFRNNGTAVLLENVPTDVTLSFENSVFSGNDTDIDNRCGQAVDISQAIFQ